MRWREPRWSSARHARSSSPTTVRYLPWVRPADIERQAEFAGQLVLAGGLGPEYQGERLGDGPQVLFVSRTLAMTLVGLLRPDVLEITEPLWLREWPFAMCLALTLRSSRRLHGDPRPIVVTYAIDNLPVDEGIRIERFAKRAPAPIQKLGNKLIRNLVGRSMFVIDGIVFGTSAAEMNYRSAWPSACERKASILFEEYMTPCALCYSPNSGDQEVTTEQVVLFAAEWSDRKGVLVLTEAWDLIPISDREGWRLSLNGYGIHRNRIREWAMGRDDVVVAEAPSRRMLHRNYALANIVVLPSVAVDGWREQVGLSILEGLSHGCRIVATSESGIAPVIERERLGTVVPPGSSRILADALLSEMRGARSGKKPLPSFDRADSSAQKREWVIGLWSQRLG